MPAIAETGANWGWDRLQMEAKKCYMSPLRQQMIMPSFFSGMFKGLNSEVG